MRISSRFEAAINKLYLAFNNDTLHPECVKQCAVGNILGNTDAWKHLSDHHGSIQLNYIGQVHEAFGRKFNGYSPKELLRIEISFLEACGYELPFKANNKRPADPTNKDILFNGLTAVVELLCHLDNIPNLMDCHKLFAYQTCGESFQQIA